MRRESREWLIGTGVLVLAASTAIGLYLHFWFVLEAVKLLAFVAFVIVTIMIVGIALPLVVGETVLDWLDGKEEKVEEEDPPFQF